VANLKAFKGYRYNKEKIEDIGKQVSPPYYNLNSYDKEFLYKVSQYNSVRLFCGKNYDDDTEQNNRFTRAADYLQKWIDDGVLKRDSEEAIYMYEQVMNVDNVQYSNRSFVGLVELEELGEGDIMTCEEIREVSRQDRYDFLTATNADLSMVSCLYVEREKDLFNLMNKIAEQAPETEFESTDGIIHRIWVITDKETIDFIIEKFKALPLYITDGQTRYETCLQYRDYMKANNPNHTGKEPYNYTMVSLMNSRSDGIAVLPVHRAVKLRKPFKLDYFVSASQDHFKIEKIIVDHGDDSIVDTMRKQIATKRSDTRIAMYCGDDFFYRMTLKDKDFIKQNICPDMSEDYCNLDTVVLNKLVLKDILMIKDEDFEDIVVLERDPNKCFDGVAEEEYSAMFVLNPVKIEQIRRVTANGEKMPTKTIGVYPKPAVGIVINIKED